MVGERPVALQCLEAGDVFLVDTASDDPQSIVRKRSLQAFASSHAGYKAGYLDF